VKPEYPKGYWQDAANRRDFFMKFAADKGFDPHDGDSWQNVTHSQLGEKMVFILASFIYLSFKKQLSQLLSRTSGLYGALEEAFPGLQLEGKFKKMRNLDSSLHVSLLSRLILGRVHHRLRKRRQVV